MKVTMEMVEWMDRAIRSGLCWEIDPEHGTKVPYAILALLREEMRTGTPSAGV